MVNEELVFRSNLEYTLIRRERERERESMLIYNYKELLGLYDAWENGVILGFLPISGICHSDVGIHWHESKVCCFGQELEKWV